MNTYRLNPNLGQLPGEGIRPAAGIAEHRRFRRCLLYAGDQRIIHILTGGVGTDAQTVRVGLKGQAGSRQSLLLSGYESGRWKRGGRTGRDPSVHPDAAWQ